jgi:hypothetical protein
MKATISPKTRCRFSRKPAYRQKTVEEVFAIDPAYITWCYYNLKGLTWSHKVYTMISRYKRQ